MKLLKIIIQRTLIIVTLILTIAILNNITFADVGSFESYDSGSSYSSSSSDWGSSSSSSYDLGSSYDWDSGSSSYSSGDDGYIPIPLVLIIIVVVVVVIVKGFSSPMIRKPKNYVKLEDLPSRSKITYDNTGILARIRQIDSNFSRVKFESFAKEVFIKLQNAWTERDWEKIRPFETTELFEQHKMQLDGYIKNNQINVMDRICVNDFNFVSFEQTSDKDILVIDLDTRMSDYIIDATTKQVIKGNKETEYYHTYTLTFTRKRGSTTETTDANVINTTNCPNCGAPTTITSAGRCEYCNSIIITNDHGWVLASLNRRN